MKFEDDRTNIFPVPDGRGNIKYISRLDFDQSEINVLTELLSAIQVKDNKKGLISSNSKTLSLNTFVSDTVFMCLQDIANKIKTQYIKLFPK